MEEKRTHIEARVPNSDAGVKVNFPYSRQHLTSVKVPRMAPVAIAQKTTHTNICPSALMDSHRSLGDSAISV
jgi:hypothetical protein